MLVLSRQQGQSVVVLTDHGEEIIVTVARVEGKKVKVGFTAPPNVIFLRQEISQRSPPPSPEHTTAAATDGTCKVRKAPKG